MSELVVSENVINEVSESLNCKKEHIIAVLEMLSDDKTVAFIARYRKEATGGLDEEEIRKIDEAYKYGVNLEKKKNDCIRLIEEKGLLTDELRNQIMASTKLIEVEDLYRPFKEKKKTKATEAIAAGLDGLADIMLKLYQRGTKEEYVNKFINDKVKTYDEAIMGAKYIVAERISDNAEYRKYIRDAALKYGTISCKKKAKAEDLDEKYANYYDSSENVGRIKPHRVLAINRAEDEGIINVSITLQPERDLDYLAYKITKKRESLFKDELLEAIADSYKRLISPSIEREIRSILSEKAEEQAIKIFSLNLKNILLQAPMKGKTVLGIDPAYRTGCKLAVISPASQVLEIGVIYPNERSKDSKIDPKEVEKSKRTIVNLIKKYGVSIIAIGNGTAGRETEAFVAEIINENKLDVKYVMVSEAGASVYSASELAIEEFPDLTVEKRSAISIARRIQDPLAELIKIDPKSIGVGQYQHDVTQSKLEKSLDDVVDDAVNKVGVNLNTASISLLSYVSGLTKATAKNIVAFRDLNGRFNSREDLKKVSKMGPKTYEQCVGFLRIIDGENKLDMTPIHPESYSIALKLLKKMNLDTNALGTEEMKNAVSKLDKNELVKELNTDMYTLNDILDAFIAPLRDIRDDYQGLILRSDIMHFEDIKVGDELDGVVRNVVDFGAFVDCGVKYDGLVHISKMSRNKVNHPSDILSVGDNVKVYVIDIDYAKHKMALSLIKEN
ncbi:MAG: RNA-binding transcriptional accessory protein [Acholeplasmatales bacterium]|nr:RNA-binding transcriptional accessory protein [Acholeplasmatales bacterium]